MNLMIDDQLISKPEIRMIGLAVLLFIISYSVNWVTGTLYDAGYDIFNIFKKKKKSRRRS